MSTEQPNLTNGFNQLYNQIFCNLFQSTTNNGFSTCDNCTLSFNSSDSVISANTSEGEQSCLNLCNDNQYCTAYTFDSNASSNNCTLYGNNSQYPTQINPGVNGSYSGYTITLPKAQYNFSNLNSDQQQNIQLKCSNQYLNNTFTPTKPNVDISSCISVESNNSNSTINVAPECLFNIYQQNNIPVTIKNVPKYENTNNINTNSVGDESITNYQNEYNQYNQLKKQNSAINQNALSTDNANYQTYFQNLSTQNLALQNNYSNNISSGNNQLLNISTQLKNSIGGNILENYENNSNTNNDNKKYILLIILIIIFVLIFVFFIFSKK